MKEVTNKKSIYPLVVGVYFGILNLYLYLTNTLSYMEDWVFVGFLLILFTPAVSVYSIWINSTNKIAYILKILSLFMIIISVALLFFLIIPYYGT